MSGARAPWPRGCVRCLQYKGEAAFPYGRSKATGLKANPERICWPCKEEIAQELDQTVRFWFENGTRMARCKRCKLGKPLAEYRTERKGDRMVQRLTCVACMNEQSRVARMKRVHGPNGEAYKGKERQRAKERWLFQQEKVKESARKYRQRLKSDPIRAAELTEKARFDRRLRQEQRGKPANRSFQNVITVESPPEPALPVAPLLEMVERAREPEESDEHLAVRLSIDGRQLRHWRVGTYHHVSFGVADRICVSMGWGLWEIWPELGQEAA